MIIGQVGHTNPPEAFVTAIAPEQVIYSLNHFQVRHLPSHQGVKLQQRSMLSWRTLFRQRHSEAEFI